MNDYANRKPPRQHTNWLGPIAAILFFSFVSRPLVASEPIPPQVQQLLRQHCADCHSGDAPEADIALISTTVDWQQTAATWERVFDALRKEQMPPADAQQLSDKSRTRLLDWLDRELSQHVPVSHTPRRRLNRYEYANTLRQLFKLPEFSLPSSFPQDDSQHGFDNVADGLVLSPPLMAQYLEIATHIADEVLPAEKERGAAKPREFAIGVGGIADGEGGAEYQGRYRLISSRNMASLAAWPARFEAPTSGEYRLTLELATYQTDKMTYPRSKKPFGIAIYARPKTDQVYAPFGQLRKLATFALLPTARRQQFTANVNLMKGEVFGIRWQDGPAFSDPPVREYSPRFLADRLKRDRRYYAAMLQYRGGPRGINQSDFYDAMVREMARDDLDLSDPRLDTMPKKWGGGIGDAPHNWISKFVHEEFRRFGPAVDIFDAKIEGPIKLVDDEQTLARRKRKSQFLGLRPHDVSNADYVRSILTRFLSRAYRRPISMETLNGITQTTLKQIDTSSDASIESYAAFCDSQSAVSPAFLYRDQHDRETGQLDQFALAERLSYFLTQHPPDAALSKLARAGNLDQAALRSEVVRFISTPASDHFVRSFTGQWLRTRELASIMADPRLLPFYDGDRNILIAETEMFFAEMLRKNHPLEDFIDPGFSYRNAQTNKVYGGDLEGNQMRRVELERGGRQGGLLGLASIMMATANGVDTHPVHRGVWLLENVLGTPTPPPPDNVPAIAPDTTGTTTMQSLLAAHRADVACASCHDKIDPLGMVMENFDPVGRWREHYPIYTQPQNEKLKKEFYASAGRGTMQGPAVETRVVLDDGTSIADVTELKQYILKNIDRFTTCLCEKLLVYATGRQLGIHDKIEVEKIVAKIRGRDNRFQDLVVEIVLSEAFAR